MSYLNSGDRIRFGPVDCILRTPDSFGTATRATQPDKPTTNIRNIILTVVAFVVTLAIMYAVFQLL